MPAISTTDTSIFGAVGVCDPYVSTPGVSIGRKVAFSVTKVAASTHYELIPVPKGFVLMGIYAYESELCDTSGTVTIALKSDDAVSASLAVGETLSEDGTATLGKVFKVTNTQYLGDGDVICVTPSAAFKDGTIDIVIHGFMANGEAITNNDSAVNAAWRAENFVEGENLSKGDPILKMR